MTQPDIINWNDFPAPEPNDMRDLTAAIRDLAEAIRQDPNGPTVRVSTAAPRGAGLAGDFSPEAWEDPNIEHVDPDSPEAVEAFWGDGGIGDQLYQRLRPKTLEDVPEGWVAELDPPRRLPKDVAEEVDIYRAISVRKVRREAAFEYDWSLLDSTEGGEEPPWGGHAKQIEALGLTYADFRPAV